MAEGPFLSLDAQAQTNLLEWLVNTGSGKGRKDKAGAQRPKVPKLLRELRQKARGGDVAAMLRLARAHDPDSIGFEVPGARKSLVEAARWYRRAAQAGDAAAQYRLARIVHLGGKGIRQSASTALVLYRAAARQGHPQAMLWLGWALLHGEGTRKDPEKAREWLQKAAEAKERRAMTALGLIYLTGEGAPRNLKLAKEWFSRAAEQQEPWAINNLAAMHEMGWGIPKDKKKAAALYERATALGLRQAAANLARLKSAESTSGQTKTTDSNNLPPASFLEKENPATKGKADFLRR
ncbi:tetratricopeptide repeat protein [Thermopetrobacter sp. TC1]|uniref:tetratricopeptide repeat protein n=1 Tax=Thermopetrobacter sp. TC1 TaxID=1495045 RepID=UPI00056DCF7D|nr:tetratricopeptide repeat protein [Thermopetrobacter sp. TC1]